MKQESSLRVTKNDQIVAGVVLDVLADEGELLESLEEPFCANWRKDEGAESNLSLWPQERT